MLCAGTEQKPYEQFGVVPSLNYSSEIEAVGDNVNCLDFQNYQKFTATATYYAIRANAFDLKANEKYTYNYEAVGDFSKSNNIKLWFRDSSNAVFKEVLAGNTFTLSNEELNKLSYIQACVQVIVAGTTYEGYIYPKITKGTKTGAYSKFGQGSVEISTSNENIIPFAYNTKKMASGVELSIDEKGVAVLNGTATVKSGALSILTDNVDWKADKFPYGKKVTFICKGLLDGVALAFAEADKNHKWLRNLAAFNNDKEFVITTCSRGENTEYIRINFTIEKDVVLNNVKLYIALVEGETNEYIGPKHSTLVMPIQQPMFSNDTFEKKDDGWYEKHNWKTLTLTGNENVSMGTSQNINYFSINNITLEDFEYIDEDTINYICTHFKAIKVSDRYKDNTMFINNIKRIALCCNELSNVDELKAKLKELHDSGKGVEVYYKLAEPLLLKCTDEQSAILDKIDTYKDTTIITTDNDLCKISLRYKQSLEAAIKEYTATTVAESE